jgi:acyl-CoA reductase-like NAD-dependent aldehyde dehydrogenase
VRFGTRYLDSMAVLRDGTIHLVDPRSGAEIGTLACTPVGEVAAAVARARVAGVAFAALPLEDRKRVVRGLGDHILARAADIAQVLVAEIGKPAGEAWTSEIVTAQELFQHWLSVIDDELAEVDVPLNPLNYPGKRVVLRPEALGVLGVIMPWNYPFHLPLRTIVPALLAGNAVVLKPSEHAARVGAILADIVRAALPAGLVEVVQGGGEVGAALIDAGVDKVVFTGGVVTGRAVAVRCAERLIPCSLELGSKDPAIVLADADLERTANGIVWGAFHNAGQDCASVERVYVDERVYEAFVAKVVAATRALRPGVDVGPMVNAEQLAKVEAQVAQAVAAGATVACGGARTGEGFGFAPTVLTGVREDMAVMVEETFGPVLPLVAVSGPEEAIARANASRYGLCGSVWGGNVDAALELALRLQCGVTYVNNCCFTGPMGGAAWVGRKESGNGITGSRYGLGGLVAVRTVCVDRSRAKRELWWFPYSDALTTMARGLVELGRSGGSKLGGAQLALHGLLNRWK